MGKGRKKRDKPKSPREVLEDAAELERHYDEAVAKRASGIPGDPTGRNAERERHPLAGVEELIMTPEEVTAAKETTMLYCAFGLTLMVDLPPNEVYAQINNGNETPWIKFPVRRFDGGDPNKTYVVELVRIRTNYVMGIG